MFYIKLYYLHDSLEHVLYIRLCSKCYIVANRKEHVAMCVLTGRMKSDSYTFQ